MSKIAVQNGQISRVVNACLALARGAYAAQFQHRLIILTYHRVLPTRDELLCDEPTREEFDVQMRLLASQFNVIGLSEAVAMLTRRTLPPRAVAVTFDDGYRNNFEHAMPILQKYHLPATFFVATGFLGDGCMWNDRVIESIRQNRSDSIDLTHHGLQTHCLRTPQDRINTIETVLSMIKHLPFDKRDSTVADIAKICETEIPRELMMTRKQVRELAQNGFEVGGHTVNHPILTRISHDEAVHEVSAGKQTLENVIDRPVELFAYPNGRRGKDYGPEHIELLKSAGFKAACTTEFGFANQQSPEFELPRTAISQTRKMRVGIELATAYGSSYR